MGARMLLAMAATATQGRDRDASASVLGMDVDDAAALAAALPQTLHPAVASAAALWTRALFDTPALRSWRSRQPESVVQGDMPSQADADEWARCTTLGLLDRFPVTIGYDW